MSARGRRQRKVLTVNTDLKLMPLMNIIIALIPMLLLSAVFIEVKIIATSLPRDAEAATAAGQAPAPPPLGLAVPVPPGGDAAQGHGVAPPLDGRHAGGPRPHP